VETQHPIEGLMKTALDSIKNMVDVNTIMGEPVETPDGKVIVPVSRVTFGFAAGGSEFDPTVNPGKEGKNSTEQTETGKTLPFGGGSGAGVSIQPMGFLIVGEEETRILPLGGQAIYDRLLDLAPKFIDKIRQNGADEQEDKKTIKYKSTIK